MIRALIVEDDAISTQVLEKMISLYGSSEVAGNGQQAIEMFLRAHKAEKPYDLILMDIMMPEVNGLQSVLAIRKLETQMGVTVLHRAKIIMTTALDDPRTVMKALYESDANSYIVKPITMEKLLKELRALKLVQAMSSDP